jgi:large subunit ribosomal protein L6
MSRIGKLPIELPEGVNITIAANNEVTVDGPKGKLQRKFHSLMNIKEEGRVVTVSPKQQSILARSLYGTTRAVLNNMVVGVSTGFSKSLTIKGVGYRAALQGDKLVINAGYSHPVELVIPKGITVDVPKPVNITVSGADKELVGEFAANIRGVRKPEPYLGKGIRYDDETIRRKEGKTA